MPYFDHVEWISGGHLPQCTAWVDKAFPNYYCLNYAHRGAVEWRTGRRPFLTLKAPVAWWTFPGPRFQYGSRNGLPWDHYFVCFRGPRITTFVKEGLLPSDPRQAWARIHDPAAFSRGFEAVLGPEQELARYPQRRIHGLENLLLHLAEPPTPSGTGAREQRLRSFVDEIRRTPATDWDFAAEARKLGLSTPHFHRLFRGLTGLPPQQFVIRSRLETAARHLLTGDSPLKSIAMTVGCPDIYYFSRLFRRHFGMPPGRYRREAGLP